MTQTPSSGLGLRRQGLSRIMRPSSARALSPLVASLREESNAGRVVRALQSNHPILGPGDPKADFQSPLFYPHHSHPPTCSRPFVSLRSLRRFAQPKTSSVCPALQVEAFVQFFLGRYSEDLTYEDDLLVSLQRNLTSVSGFWFDCVTSIPWSYMDLHLYLVRCGAHSVALD